MEEEFLDEIKREIDLRQERNNGLMGDNNLDPNIETFMIPEKKLDITKSDVKNKKVLAVIPCFNEEATIGSVVIKTKRYVDEVIVIDDGSSDDTAKIAKTAGANVIFHENNMGKGAGIRSGFRYAVDNDFNYVVTLDGDGQHNADEIPNLIGRMLSVKGIDISLGVRHGDDTEMPLWRKVGKRVLDYSTSFGSGGLVTDSQCGFRAFSKKAVTDMLPRLKSDAFNVESEQIILANKLGLKTANTHISCRYNSLKTDTSTKTSTSHGFSVLGYIIWLIAERRPLIFIGLPGVSFVIIGIFLAILTLQEYNMIHVFSIQYALLTTFFLIMGTLAVFIGLLFNTLPHIIQRTVEEAQRK